MYYRDTRKTNEKLVKAGGIIKKYQFLIERLRSGNSKIEVKFNEPNFVILGYSFVGNGYIKFQLQVVKNSLFIDYETMDSVDGKKKTSWKFDENLNQEEMFKIVSNDIILKHS